MLDFVVQIAVVARALRKIAQHQMRFGANVVSVFVFGAQTLVLLRIPRHGVIFLQQRFNIDEQIQRGHILGVEVVRALGVLYRLAVAPLLVRKVRLIVHVLLAVLMSGVAFERGVRFFVLAKLD